MTDISPGNAELIERHPHLIAAEVANPHVGHELELQRPIQTRLDRQPDDEPVLDETARATGFMALPGVRASLQIGITHQADRTGKDVSELI